MGIAMSLLPLGLHASIHSDMITDITFLRLDFCYVPRITGYPQSSIRCISKQLTVAISNGAESFTETEYLGIYARLKCVQQSRRRIVTHPGGIMTGADR